MEHNTELLSTITNILEAAPDTALDISAKEQQLVKDIAEMTENNDHNGVGIELAKYLKSPKYTKIMDAIETIQKANGHMPKEVQTYRDYVVSEMIYHIKTKNPTLAQQVHDAT